MSMLWILTVNESQIHEYYLTQPIYSHYKLIQLTHKKPDHNLQRATIQTKKVNIAIMYYKKAQLSLRNPRDAKAC